MVSVPGTTFLTCACHAPQVSVRGPMPKVQSVALLWYWSEAQCPKCGQLLFYGTGQRPSAQSAVSCSFLVLLVQGIFLICVCRTQHSQEVLHTIMLRFMHARHRRQNCAVSLLFSRDLVVISSVFDITDEMI